MHIIAKLGFKSSHSTVYTYSDNATIVVVATDATVQYIAVAEQYHYCHHLQYHCRQKYQLSTVSVYHPL